MESDECGAERDSVMLFGGGRGGRGGDPSCPEAGAAESGDREEMSSGGREAEERDGGRKARRW